MVAELCSTVTNKYTCVMNTGRVAYCPVLSHVDYAPRTLLRLEKDGPFHLSYSVFVFIFSLFFRLWAMR